MTDPGPRGLRLAGLGGQGVILAGLILGQAAVAGGLYAAGASSYGAQARGSACQAELIISPEPIDYPHLEEADLLVAMSQGGYEAWHGHLAPGGRVLYDSGLVTPEGQALELGLPVNEIALQELGGSQPANVVWVGALAGFTGWFAPEALALALAENVPPRRLEINQRALARGLELGRGLGRA